ncbi:MAG TPA: hypothetical protein VFT02_13800 [Pyrinomonadaceae bacterium]|nr:hypothetical protein [Pyrinomonadaceae bacterium]
MTDRAVVEVLRGGVGQQRLRGPRILAAEGDHVLVPIVRELDGEL